MNEKTLTVGLSGYRILQAPNMSPTQMMSYLITTPSGKLMVIDGGTAEDAPYLIETIHRLGSEVSLWIVTHMHYDHYQALGEILKQPDTCGITIKRLLYQFPPAQWVHNAEPHFLEVNSAFYALLPPYESITQIAREGDVYELDGMTIEILKDPSDYADYDPAYQGGSTVNDTSIVFKVCFPNKKSVLFLGDLGLRAGHRLADSCKERLKSDIVQMAHHGQNGAGEDVYRLVQPKLCMWTAPMWLYDNNPGLRDESRENRFDSGPFKTLIVRRWMDELGVTLHAVEGEGPVWIV